MKKPAMRVLQSVFGLPTWQVRWHPQVGLDMQFGTPKLEVREPHVSNAKSPRVRAIFARRGVHLRGTHSLCVAPRCWRLQLGNGLTVRDTSTIRQLDCAVARLRGEKLEGFRIDARIGATILYFDLGARITIRKPAGGIGDWELWSLSNSSRVVGIDASGTYRYGSVHQSLDTNYAIEGDDNGFVILAHTAKVERALRKDLPGVAV